MDYIKEKNEKEKMKKITDCNSCKGTGKETVKYVPYKHMGYMVIGAMAIGYYANDGIPLVAAGLLLLGYFMGKMKGGE